MFLIRGVELRYYLHAACMTSAAFSRKTVLPTFAPVAPAIKKGIKPGSLTVPSLGDGLKSGKHDRTPCRDESMRKRVTFR